jgi:membrane-associated phospholipid phosphatase
MQTILLNFFQSIASPGLDFLAEGMTMLGETGVYILIIASFFWGISKKTGMIMSSTLLISLFLNNLLKIIFHSPRPFEVLDNLEGKRLETATGYSFPSGHTQGASSFYTTQIYLYHNRMLRILCILAILMVGISRLYLGVHWPVDVLGGWILGITSAWMIASLIDRLWEVPEKLDRFLLIFILLVALAVMVMVLLELFLFKDSLKRDDFFKGSGLLLGCLISMPHRGLLFLNFFVWSSVWQEWPFFKAV